MLLMRDGSKYVGDFNNGEMTGQGRRVYEDGTEYTGEFQSGERHGEGEISYGKRNYREEFYKGSWVLNVRSGFGQLLYRSGKVIKGNFEKN